MRNTPKHIEYLFVYGSLRKEAQHRVFSKVEDCLNYVGAGYLNGLLYNLGKYPGVIEGAEDEHKVKGEVYAIEEDRNYVLRLLDEYEGYERENKSDSLFVRRKREVKLKNGKRIVSWVYIYNRPEKIKKAELITSGDYLRFIKKTNHA